MKGFSILAITTVVIALVSGSPTATEARVTPQEALAQSATITLPDGVVLTGTVEPVDEPTEDETNKHEFYGGLGLGGGLGWGGGLGGFGFNRLGFSCGGIGGWAYPLGYWNAFGAGIYGGGCGLGVPFGGMFYC